MGTKLTAKSLQQKYPELSKSKARDFLLFLRARNITIEAQLKPEHIADFKRMKE